MNIFEIDNAIMDCIDMETGEVIDIDRLDALQMQREEKVENVALWIKELSAEADALKAESQKLSKRKQVAENKITSLKNYLRMALDGQKFETPKAVVSFRKSKSVEINNFGLLKPEYLTYAEPKANKTAIRKAINEGKEVAGADLVENLSVIVG